MLEDLHYRPAHENKVTHSRAITGCSKVNFSYTDGLATPKQPKKVAQHSSPYSPSPIMHTKSSKPSQDAATETASKLTQMNPEPNSRSPKPPPSQTMAQVSTFTHVNPVSSQLSIRTRPRQWTTETELIIEEE